MQTILYKTEKNKSKCHETQRGMKHVSVATLNLTLDNLVEGYGNTL